MKAVDDAEVIIQCLEDIRNEEYFSSLFDKAKELAINLDVEEKTPRLTKRQRNRANAESLDAKQHYFRDFFLPFLDHMIVVLNEQLIHSRTRLVAQYLIPSRLSQLSQIAEKNIFDAYRSDCEYDEKELKIWSSKLCTISEKDKPKIACETLVCMSKDTFPNIYSALTILATMPVSTANAERSFSTLKRLKTWLRNTMCQSRLTGLALMHLHWNVDVDVERVLRDFDPLNDRHILLAFD